MCGCVCLSRESIGRPRPYVYAVGVHLPQGAPPIKGMYVAGLKGEMFFQRKLINYTKNELQGINILKLRLPNGLKCCFKFFYCRNR